MISKMFLKQFNIFIIGIALSSLSVSSLRSEDEIERSKNYFDIRDKNIGFFASPTPNSSNCLLAQAVIGSTTTIYRNSVMSPSIAVNPQDKHFIVAAWEQDVTSTSGAGLDIG